MGQVRPRSNRGQSAYTHALERRAHRWGADCLPTPLGGGGGALFGALASPGRAHTHIRKIVLRGKTKFIKEDGNLLLILGTQTVFWPLIQPPTQAIGCMRSSHLYMGFFGRTQRLEVSQEVQVVRGPNIENAPTVHLSMGRLLAPKSMVPPRLCTGAHKKCYT